MTEDHSLLLGIEVRGTGLHPAAWRRPDSRAEEVFDAAYWVDAAVAADAAGIDLLFLPDSFDVAASTGRERGQLDAVATAARVVTATDSIGILPEVTVTHTEPFHTSKAIASLDFASQGRAGWTVGLTRDRAQARLFGRKDVQDDRSLWDEAAESVEVVRALWDSWEDDAEIRDAATGRFIDRDKLHYIDFAGEHFSVKGPSITPRPPQGQPLVTVRADGSDGIEVAARHGDLIRIQAPVLASAREIRSDIRARVGELGRDPDRIRVLLDLDVHIDRTVAAADQAVAELNRWSGEDRTASTEQYIGDPNGLTELLSWVAESDIADGVVLRPLAVPAALPWLDDVVSPLRRPRTVANQTLRGRLGLPRPTNRFAA
ncbi:LLM class flavin-dependent oxidoreductase [Antrihabitans cavernicola]|uniref:LLM class flavin-dependent oxidoreductase n=1 Tax=Antrihabitans cavernicola TaxID=2495913 RepID=A0A5A7S514_9NOCA|nr:LLM class flavin-dependent oxidoreductase [Spelaeibacter cavernicola]KAA0017088.1 LLM class flavin-dependent oxidoreductase [Spelaeibacter cavernicola]